MRRLLLGSILLGAALVTGILAGTTGEARGRSAIRVRTLEYGAGHEPAPEAVAAEELERVAGPASAAASKEDPPEASDLVTRMRRQLPQLGEVEAERIRKYHRDYTKRLHQRSMAVTAALLADPESQRRAVQEMRELRRERREFMRDLLGAERWEKWKRIELNGGRNVDEFLRLVREHNKENEE